MKFVDISNPERISRDPDSSIILFSEGNYSENGFTITKVELRLFIEKVDDIRGPYSIITSLMETENDSIEMVYQEGFLGDNPLKDASNFLTSNLGISGLLKRSTISLKSYLKKD